MCWTIFRHLFNVSDTNIERHYYWATDECILKKETSAAFFNWLFSTDVRLAKKNINMMKMLAVDVYQFCRPSNRSIQTWTLWKKRLQVFCNKTTIIYNWYLSVDCSRCAKTLTRKSTPQVHSKLLQPLTNNTTLEKVFKIQWKNRERRLARSRYVNSLNIRWSDEWKSICNRSWSTKIFC